MNFRTFLRLYLEERNLNFRYTSGFYVGSILARLWARFSEVLYTVAEKN